MSNDKAGKFTGITAITLLGMLAATAGVGFYLWTSLEGVEMTGHGWAAMVLGIVFSLALGVGLMALVFISSRRGYDDEVS